VAASSRRKGIRGEGDVARIFRAGGVTVEKLQQQQGGVCDLIAGDRFYVDVKRAERLKLPEWLRQAADEAPQSGRVVCGAAARGAGGAGRMSDSAAFLIAGLVCLWLAPAWVWVPLFVLSALCAAVAVSKGD
jgi:hypothetical protein